MLEKKVPDLIFIRYVGRQDVRTRSSVPLAIWTVVEQTLNVATVSCITEKANKKDILQFSMIEVISNALFKKSHVAVLVGTLAKNNFYWDSNCVKKRDKFFRQKKEPLQTAAAANSLKRLVRTTFYLERTKSDAHVKSKIMKICQAALLILLFMTCRTLLET